MVKSISLWAEGGVTELFIRAGRLVGATIIGRNKDRAPITELIKSRANFSKDFLLG